MSRTQRSNSGDLPQLDGHIFVPVLATDLVAGTAANVAYVPNFAGAIFVQMATAGQYVFGLQVNQALVERYGVQDDLQEYFGSSQPVGAQGLQVGQPTAVPTSNVAAGTNISVPVLSSVNFSVGQWCTVSHQGTQETAQINAIPDATHIQFASLTNPYSLPFLITANLFTTPAGVSGSPPFPGVTQFSPVTKPRPKGILIKQLDFVYLIGAAAATNNSIQLIATNYLNNSIRNVTSLTGAAVVTAPPFNTNLQTTPTPGDGTTTYTVTPVQIPAANQQFLTTRDTQVSLFWNIVVAAGGYANLVGVFLDVSFNYN